MCHVSTDVKCRDVTLIWFSLYILKQRKHISTILWCVSKILFFIGVICQETHQLHRVHFFRCNMSRLYRDKRRDVTLIWLFPLHIKTTQTYFNHIMVRLKNFIFHRCNMSGDAPITPCLIFHRCNISRLYKNSQILSFSDSQFLNLLKLSKRVPVGHR